MRAMKRSQGGMAACKVLPWEEFAEWAFFLRSAC